MSLPPFPSDYRASGVLLHVTSLPSPYGIGDVGPTALAWIDRLHEAGQSWWQALPVGPIGVGDGDSPYQPLSSFAGNGLLMSPDWLIEDGLLRLSDCEGPVVFVRRGRLRRCLLLQAPAARQGLDQLQCRRASGSAARLCSVLPGPCLLVGGLRAVSRAEVEVRWGPLS